MCSITAILVRNRGLGTARFAELAAGAGARLRHPMRDFRRFWGGLIGVQLLRAPTRTVPFCSGNLLGVGLPRTIYYDQFY